MLYLTSKWLLEVANGRPLTSSETNVGLFDNFLIGEGDVRSMLHSLFGAHMDNNYRKIYGKVIIGERPEGRDVEFQSILTIEWYIEHDAPWACFSTTDWPITIDYQYLILAPPIWTTLFLGSPSLLTLSSFIISPVRGTRKWLSFKELPREVPQLARTMEVFLARSASIYRNVFTMFFLRVSGKVLKTAALAAPHFFVSLNSLNTAAIVSSMQQPIVTSTHKHILRMANSTLLILRYHR